MQKLPLGKPSQSLDTAIPIILRPLFRAYILGYASSAGPRLLTLFLVHLSRHRKNIDPRPDGEGYFWTSLVGILKGGLEIQRFPTFCAALVGGTYFSLKLLQSRPSKTFTEDLPYETKNGVELRPTRFAGRTLDLTLFAFTRAVDCIVGELWARRKSQRQVSGRWSRVDRTISSLTDPALFATSCALIMWAFIYTPARLPGAYNKWIKSAAQVDSRLLKALRYCRYGELKYGVETGQAHLLGDMCKDYGLPEEYGDPTKFIPFPCELVHMGAGPSCEFHAVSRFYKSFIWSASMYLPLNLALIFRNPKVSKKALTHALKSSARSSAFLSTFITLFYYGICLTRTKFGPQILGTSPHACQAIDSGYCIGTGCWMCGWSVFIESAKRREEMGLFVAPRALATLLPRRYRWEDQWIERAIFAWGAAVVFTCVGENRNGIRGVLGKVVGGVLHSGGRKLEFNVKKKRSGPVIWHILYIPGLTIFSSIMSVPDPPSRSLSKTVFYNPNGTRSEGIRCPADRDCNVVFFELYAIERESIRIAILDPSSWRFFDSNRNYEIARVFPNLKEIIFVCARPENLDKYSKRRSALQFVPLRAGRYVQSGPRRHYLTERSSLRIEKLIRKQHGKPLDTDDEEEEEEREEEECDAGFLGDGDEKNKYTEEEDPTDDTGQGEDGFEDYSRWEDKRKEFEDMFHAEFTESDGLLYHERDSDPRISIPKITFYGITELES
ncbi:putative integral membrane protein [Botrytis fragariae]|uniref:Putative integral membrane protein n=1 Tax=Botrytis fragariae TaxID=1964551 RepID=A0A8H6AXF0_9HELO|nr:putative integral membrane protein [Botrytis fragariae]KAF5875346.1 putative integral membrane protein [Botrytis fragariae]